MCIKTIRMLIYTILLIFLTQALMAQSENNKTKAKDLYEEALVLHKENNDDGALPLLRKAVALDSSQIWAKKLLVELLVAKGEKLYEQGYQKSAYNIFSEAVKYWSNHPSVSYWYFKLRPIQNQLVDKVPEAVSETDKRNMDTVEKKSEASEISKNEEPKQKETKIAEKEIQRVVVEKTSSMDAKTWESMMKIEERLNRQMMLILESQQKNQVAPVREIIQLPATEKDSGTNYLLFIGLGFMTILILGFVFFMIAMLRKQDNSMRFQRAGYMPYQLNEDNDPGFYYQSSSMIEHKQDKKAQEIKAIQHETSKKDKDHKKDHPHMAIEQQSNKSGSDLMDLRAVMPLAKVVDSKVYRRDQSVRVGKAAYHMAVALNLSPQEAELYYIAGLAHDIGYLDISSEILNKQEELSQEEFEMIKQHPERGIKLLEFTHIHPIVHDGIRYHHERWNGLGYPEGLSGEEIPLVGRVIAIVDAFEALISPRPYRPPFSETEAIHKIQEAAGAYFDPNLMEPFKYVVSHHLLFKDTRFDKR